MRYDLNAYRLGGWGYDVSSQRLDALDFACCRYALGTGRRPKQGIDLGCGLGTVSIGLAILGTRMLSIDLMPLESHFESVHRIAPTANLEFRRLDVRSLSKADLAGKFDFFYSRRFLHYLAYGEAETLVGLISDHLVGNGRVFISVSGLNSELGTGYAHRKRPIESRHTVLSTPMAEKHNISERVCLYNRNDLSKLFRHHGLRAVKLWESDFGNIQGIFSQSKNSQ